MTQLTDEDRALIFDAIKTVLSEFRLDNMADENGLPYPLLDLMSNPAPDDIGTGLAQIDRVSWEIRDAVIALLSAARTQSQGEGWEPIETAPRDGEELLVWGMSIGRRVASAKDVPRHEPYEWPGGWDFPTGATHWRPLPAPPASQTKG